MFQSRRIALSLLFALLATASASAQYVINVNDPRDLADFDLLDGFCDADPAMAGYQCTLRAAIENANLLGGVVDINLGAGVYGLSRWGTDDVARWGDLDIYSGGLIELRINGAPGLTIIDASPLSGQGYPDRVIDIRNTVDLNFTCVISGVAITGGAGVNYGAGIRHDGGQLELSDCTLSNNTANHSGGGLHTSDGRVTLLGGAVGPGNQAQHGAGMHVDAAGTFDAFSTAFIGNVATAKGGGLRLRNGNGALTLCVFELNNAQSGGGISSRGSLLVRDSTLRENQATGTGGGLAVSSALTTVTGTTLEMNSAQQGGGIAVDGLGSLDISDSRLLGNAAALDGGGVKNSGAMEMRRCTIALNSALNTVGGGGGVYLFGASTLVNCTISGNEAPAGRGGGVYVLGTNPMEFSALTIAWNQSDTEGAGVHGDVVFGVNQISIITSILAGNSLTNGLVANYFGQPVNSLGFNLDTDGTMGLSAPGDQSFVAAQLGPLQFNGGPTETHALLASSAAIDAGACADVSGLVIGVDQRSVIRSGACDAGAYESPFASTPCPADLDHDGQVGFGDLVTMLAAWGSTASPADLDGDGTVGFSDLVALLAAWGVCP